MFVNGLILRNKTCQSETLVYMPIPDLKTKNVNLTIFVEQTFFHFY